VFGVAENHLFRRIWPSELLLLTTTVIGRRWRTAVKNSATNIENPPSPT
jgi:hypothetical protein